MPRSQTGEKGSSSSPSQRDTRQHGGWQGSRPDSSTDNDRHNEVETQRAITGLASRAEAIRRLADVVQFLGSYDGEVDLIEGVHRQEIERERTIQKLRGTVEELAL